MAMVIPATVIGINVVAGIGKMKMVVLHKGIEVLCTLRVRHRLIEQRMTQRRGAHQGGGKPHVARRNLFGHHARGHMIRTRAAACFGQRQGA